MIYGGGTKGRDARVGRPAAEYRSISQQLAQNTVLHQHAARRKAQCIAAEFRKAVLRQPAAKMQLPLGKFNAIAGVQRGEREPLCQPQPKHDEILGGAAALWGVYGGRGQKRGGVFRRGKAPARKTAVRGRADADVIVAVPINQVVAAFKPRAREIGNFVLRVSQRRQLFYGGQIEVCRRRPAGGRLPKAVPGSSFKRYALMCVQPPSESSASVSRNSPAV